MYKSSYGEMFMRIKVQRDQNPCTNPHGKKGISTKAHMEKCACV